MSSPLHILLAIVAVVIVWIAIVIACDVARARRHLREMAHHENEARRSREQGAGR